MTHWRIALLFLVLVGAACDGGVDGPGFDDELADQDQGDQDNVDIGDRDQTTDTDTSGGDTVLAGDGDGTDGDATGGDGTGGDATGGDDAGGGDSGGDGMAGGDDVPPTDDDPPPPTPVVTSFLTVSATTQSALAGRAVAADPEVEVRDQFGAPMAGVTVRFAITAGGGAISPTTDLTTNALGRAKLDSWTLGKSAIPNGVRASLPAHAALGNKQFSASVQTDFQIELVFLDPPTDDQRRAFEDAAARWSGVIVNDVANVSFTRDALPDDCGRIPGNTTPVPVDDLLIYARVGAIDGPGGTLAQAGPCLGRFGGAPAVGIMSFDSADISGLEQAGLFDETILHEMGHVIGIGTYWDSLVANPSLPSSPGTNTVFTGAFAQDAYVSVEGADVPTPVPVDNTAQPGSADAHWRESIFTNELMSPSLAFDETILPLSIVTVASLADLGFYVANPDAADFFSLAPTLRAPSSNGTVIENWCEIVRPSGVIAIP